MNAAELVGLNTKWYRYQNGWTQERLAEKTGFKMAYISTIETGNANLTCKSLDSLAKALDVDCSALLEENTARRAQKIPKRVDMFKQ